MQASDAGAAVVPRVRALKSAPPPLESLDAAGYTVSFSEDPDRVGDWANCHPGCKNAAYQALLLPSVELAEADIPRRVEEFARGWAPCSADPLAELERRGGVDVVIHRLVVSDVQGRDYRESGCAIPDAAAQLRYGVGAEAAWDEVRRLRDKYQLEGALLPGRGEGDELFLFVSATGRVTTHVVVKRVHWPQDAGSQ